MKKSASHKLVTTCSMAATNSSGRSSFTSSSQRHSARPRDQPSSPISSTQGSSASSGAARKSAAQKADFCSSARFSALVRSMERCRIICASCSSESALPNTAVTNFSAVGSTDTLTPLSSSCSSSGSGCSGVPCTYSWHRRSASTRESRWVRPRLTRA